MNIEWDKEIAVISFRYDGKATLLVARKLYFDTPEDLQASIKAL